MTSSTSTKKTKTVNVAVEQPGQPEKILLDTIADDTEVSFLFQQLLLLPTFYLPDIDLVYCILIHFCVLCSFCDFPIKLSTNVSSLTKNKICKLVEILFTSAS